VRSLIISDLHLGTASGRDTLRDPGTRATLLREVERADQLVLLGDVLELRGTPVSRVLDRARPVLSDLGEAAGDARVVIVPGNHDHQLAGEWLEGRRQRDMRAPLKTVETWRPGRSGLAAKLARSLGREVLMAYPGLWVGPGVWATHGHYLDCHTTVPAVEVLAGRVAGRLTGVGSGGPRSPGDHEAMTAPLYAFNYEVAQAVTPGRRRSGSGGSLRLWRRFASLDGTPSLAQLLLGGVALPAAIAAVNRSGLGRFESDLSPGALRRAALRAMGTAVERLGIDAEHVVFGHTHRAGPLPRDPEAEGWAEPGRPRLWNSGSWVYEPAVVGPPGKRSGHWPGATAVVEDEGPPRLERLLGEDAAPGLERLAEASAVGRS
jgi:hypothetical protein